MVRWMGILWRLSRPLETQLVSGSRSMHQAPYHYHTHMDSTSCPVTQPQLPWTYSISNEWQIPTGSVRGTNHWGIWRHTVTPCPPVKNCACSVTVSQSAGASRVTTHCPRIANMRYIVAASTSSRRTTLSQRSASLELGSRSTMTLYGVRPATVRSSATNSPTNRWSRNPTGPTRPPTSTSSIAW